ncbi:MAG: hypothetical protein ACQEWV_15690 [Bacillota bacterium]
MMERFKMNNTQDIVVLKQKLATYKHTLETLKAGEVVEDYLLMKNECYAIKNQVSKLEGEVKTMKETQDLQITEYEKRVKIISDQVESVNESLGQLKEDVTLLTSKVNSLNFNDLLIKIDNMITTQYAATPSKEAKKSEIKILKEEIAQLKKHLTTEEQLEGTPLKKTTTKLQPTSYKQLRNMIHSSNNIHSSLNVERRIIASYIDQSNQLQQYRQFIPTEGTKIKQERNHLNNKIMTNIAPKNQMDNQLIIKKTKKLYKNNSEDSQIKMAEIDEKQENSPQVNQDHTTFNQNLDSSTSTETIEHTEIQKNISEISTVNLDKVQEVVYQAPVQKEVKIEDIKMQTVETEYEQSPVRSNIKPSDTEQIFLDEDEPENNVEEKPSFFSFLQRSKYFGK